MTPRYALNCAVEIGFDDFPNLVGTHLESFDMIAAQISNVFFDQVIETNAAIMHIDGPSQRDCRGRYSGSIELHVFLRLNAANRKVRSIQRTFISQPECQSPLASTDPAVVGKGPC